MLRGSVREAAARREAVSLCSILAHLLWSGGVGRRFHLQASSEVDAKNDGPHAPEQGYKNGDHHPHELSDNDKDHDHDASDRSQKSGQIPSPCESRPAEIQEGSAGGGAKGFRSGHRDVLRDVGDVCLLRFDLGFRSGHRDVVRSVASRDSRGNRGNRVLLRPSFRKRMEEDICGALGLLQGCRKEKVKN